MDSGRGKFESTLHMEERANGNPWMNGSIGIDRVSRGRDGFFSSLYFQFG